MAESIIKNSSDLNIDLNSQDHDGWTPFHFVCVYGQLKIADMLLRNCETCKSIRKKDLNTENNNGDTGFHLACFEGHMELAELLLQHHVCCSQETLEKHCHAVRLDHID